MCCVVVPTLWCDCRRTLHQNDCSLEHKKCMLVCVRTSKFHTSVLIWDQVIQLLLFFTFLFFTALIIFILFQDQFHWISWRFLRNTGYFQLFISTRCSTLHGYNVFNMCKVTVSTQSPLKVSISGLHVYFYVFMSKFNNI